ncbi:SPRY domain-containing protein [Plasmodiophora brassicae]
MATSADTGRRKRRRLDGRDAKSWSSLLTWMLVDDHAWAMFDVESVVRVSCCDRQCRSALPQLYRPMTMATVSRVLRRRHEALVEELGSRRGYFGFGPLPDGLVLPDLDESPAAVLSVCGQSDDSPESWRNAFHLAHTFTTFSIFKRHRIHVNSLCTFAELKDFVHQRITNNRRYVGGAKLNVLGMPGDDGAIVVNVLAELDCERISAICDSLSTPNLFDIVRCGSNPQYRDSHDLVFYESPKVHIDHQCSDADLAFPILADAILQRHYSLTLGRQKHDVRLEIYDGSFFLFRADSVTSLHEYLLLANVKSLPQFDDEEVPSGQRPHSPASFNADAAFPNLSRFVRGKTYQSVDINSWAFGLSTVHVGANFLPIDMTSLDPRPHSLHAILAELDLLCAPANVRQRRKEYADTQHQEESIPDEYRHRRFTVHTKAARVANRGSIFSKRSSERHANALVGSNVFQQPYPDEFVFEFEVLSCPMDPEFDYFATTMFGLVDPSEQPKMRAMSTFRAQYFQPMRPDRVFFGWTGHKFSVLGKAVFPADINDAPDDVGQAPFKKGDLISIIVDRSKGHVSFALNGLVQPFYFVGVRMQNFYATGLQAFVALNGLDNYLCIRCNDRPRMEFVYPDSASRTAFDLSEIAT